jgi:hypothetical protein
MAHLNSQIGFDDHKYTWKCTECGHKNSVSRDNIYESHEDYWHQNNEDEDGGTTDANDDALAEAVGAFLLLGAVYGINKAAPHINEWWHDKAVPSLKKMKGKITGKNERAA